ncbi:hypothetical protein AB0J07_35865, partial [Microbispora rosea]
MASAPVNFGVYRQDGAPLGPQEVLATMSEAGYDGTDSGPLGLLSHRLFDYGGGRRTEREPDADQL